MDLGTPNATQVLNTRVSTDSQPPLVLERADVASCPLGKVGNLQFTAKQGGTARASAVGLTFSRARRALANAVIGLAYKFNLVSKEMHARYGQLLEARNNSRLVGNVLGALTAPAGDPEGRAGLAKRLMELAKLSQGRLNDLKGGRESLGWYVEELKDADLKALRDGVLSSQDACQAALDQISSDRLRKQAFQVLSQIFDAIIDEVEVRKNSRLIVDFLNDMLAMANGSKDHARIAERLTHLGELSGGNLASLKGAQESLSFYFKELKNQDFYNLHSGWKLDDVEVILDKISKNVDDPLRRLALQALDCIRDALRVRGLKNVRESWMQLGELLSADEIDRQDLKKSLLHVCKWLYPADKIYENLSEEQQNKVLLITQEEKLNDCLMALNDDDTDEAKKTSVHLKEFHAWAKANLQKPGSSV